MLSKRNNGKVDVPDQIIKKLLNEQEIRWNEKQKIKAEERIELKLKKASKKGLYKETFEGLHIMVRAINIRRRIDKGNKIKTTKRKFYC